MTWLITLGMTLQQLEKTEQNKGGRPPKAEQSHTLYVLKPYFQLKKSAKDTAKKTGYNIKTVTNYFNYLYELEKKSVEDNFVEQQKLANEYALYKMVSLIEMLEARLFALEKQIESSEKIDPVLERLFMSQMEMLYDFTQNKAAIEMTPTLDVSLDELITQKIQGR